MIETKGIPISPSIEDAAQSPVTAERLSALMQDQEKEVWDELGGSAEKIAEALGSDLRMGLNEDESQLARRVEKYGGNYFKEKELTSYMTLVCEGLQDPTIIMLLLCAAVSFIMEVLLHEDHDDDDDGHGAANATDTGGHGSNSAAVPGWLESVAIVITVMLVVNVAAGIDYRKERLFRTLSKELEKSNKKLVVRNGKPVEVTDRDIVVGDIVQFNSHMLASIPADGILIDGDSIKIEEASLTGEPEPMAKVPGFNPSIKARPFIFSGTEVKSGSGTMLVVAVGPQSVTGKIKMQVYGDTGDEDEKSPLFNKLQTLAMQIGKGGTIAALVCLGAMCIIGFGVKGLPAKDYIMQYLMTAITVVVVAVPEGLPLAVTLSLAFSSYKMMDENNLVKHLDACETMGSATTICSDKTGTLTANRMTVQGCWFAGEIFMPDHSYSLSSRVQASAQVGDKVRNVLGTLICVDTMNESFLQPNPEAPGGFDFKGNPTECSLLAFAAGLGFDYGVVRSTIPGRSQETLAEGKPFMFTSARKMMSWAVRNEETGGYRVYCKGASEIILTRCKTMLQKNGTATAMDSDDLDDLQSDVIKVFASEAMRTLGLAYRDCDAGFDWATTSLEGLSNADGSPALEAECGLTLLGIVGIEDPLRPEVAPAIQRCYQAGIDVRMVTGDNPDTAVAIAARCGILRAEHFDGDFNDPKNRTLKPDRAMTGKDFRTRVHDPTQKNEKGEPLFLQEEFDKIWPRLRVLARSSPEDKLTLANGLNKSMLCFDKDAVAQLRSEGITIFPDRQVVAMTGDGTNDAPALKRADVGFAMGISGTQTAKDAADIILLDDNFASIVTAANWGRNVFDSISKFLQFQLTVNIAALSVALVGALYKQESPLRPIQMLWVNVIMDSLASLALATEPPTTEQLERPPVNRSDSIITRRMWANMLGHAFYQVVVMLFLLFAGHELFTADKIDGAGYYAKHSDYSVHYTLIFNTFVLMQLVNEVNMRKLYGEWNVFEGILKNYYFLSILVITFLLQILMVEAFGPFMSCAKSGLNTTQWGISILFAVGEFPCQQIINLVVTYITDPYFASLEAKKKAEAGV